MRILTFSAIKGGVGKTTLAFNYGEWLAANGKKVLFMDLDHQSNLSQTYGIYDDEETIGNIFEGQGKVNIHEINENISIIAGDMHLDDIERKIENNTQKNMLLYLWLSNNYETLNLGRFDYIILDTHPDFSTATKNAAIISHAIISPVTPSEYGFKAQFNLGSRLSQLKKEAIEFSTGKSYVSAQLFIVANMLKHNTNSSHELEKELDNISNVIARVPEKELFNRTTLDKKSLSTMQQDHNLYIKHRDFFDGMDEKFQKMTDAINA